jgi:hypothetical protein
MFISFSLILRKAYDMNQEENKTNRLSRRDLMAIEIARIKMQAKMVARGNVNLSLGYGDDSIDCANIVSEADDMLAELDKANEERK